MKNLSKVETSLGGGSGPMQIYPGQRKGSLALKEGKELKKEKIYSFQLKPGLGMCVGFPRSAAGPVGRGKVLLCEKLQRQI